MQRVKDYSGGFRIWYEATTAGTKMKPRKTTPSTTSVMNMCGLPEVRLAIRQPDAALRFGDDPNAHLPAGYRETGMH